MTDKRFKSLIEMKHSQGLFAPHNEAANDLTHNLKHNEIICFEEVKARDLKFHRAYFGLLKYIYEWLPKNFKLQVPEKYFYNWLKVLQGSYEVIFEFKDGIKMYEYQSISFGNMSQKNFEGFVKLQLSVIYEDVIHQLYEPQIATDIIENIEETFEKYLAQL